MGNKILGTSSHANYYKETSVYIHMSNINCYQLYWFFKLMALA